MSRRTVTRTAVWGVPVVTTAVAAPALAASAQPCTDYGDGNLWTDWKGKVSQISFGSSDASSLVADVSFALTSKTSKQSKLSSDTGTTGQTQYDAHWTYLVLMHDEGMQAGDLLTMTIQFPVAVQNFAFTLTQVGLHYDSDHRRYDYIDRVDFGTTGQFAISSRGAGVSVTTANDGVTPAGLSGSTYEDIQSSANDVRVTFPGQHSVFTINYAVDPNATSSDCGEWVGVGNFSCSNCL